MIRQIGAIIMATKTTKLIKKSSASPALSVNNTSYAAAKKAEIALQMPSGFPLNFHLEGLFVQLSSVSTAATLSIKICTDSAGDEAIVASSDASIDAGITTGTKGSCIFKIDLDYVFDSSPCYVFFKVNAGSATVDLVEFTYSE
tara:strand:- start:301 stop:732 length:432 start_codon:yes stop_codon:yes gene_type:complete